MGLITPQRPAKELFKPYSDEEKVALAKKYTSAQMEVVEAGEVAVPAEDLDRQGVIRTDLGGLPYLDDLSIVQGVIDKKPEVNEPMDPNARLMTAEEYGLSMDLYLERFEKHNEGLDINDPDYLKKVRPNRRDVMEAGSEAPMFMGSNGPMKGHDVRAPSVPRYTAGSSDEPVVKKKEDDEEELDDRDPEGIYDQLRKQTGYSLDDILSFKSKLLVQHRVVNQTRLGKISSMYILAIAGDGNGRLGLGQAKGQEATNTMNLAKISAIKNMRPIPRYEDRTIFGDVKAKVSAVEVEIMARPPGFGLRCQHLIFEMARAAGIQDLAARVPRSRNKMNTVKATYQALTSQRIPEEIARGRGLKMVDVRKVYYGGRV
ncbi:small ribosomal subunit uS5m [Hyphodiscus hymeniophilus]|uniref:Small ribosomal subunit protein uS5m n=1 Tax=Hyphodiscus hymeniophilus TaxID=353542 RepID=A0A9P6VN30_9HELO|nr:small ribosomal subunit uS5m [Hyphodiscus hymeniophilus]